MKKNIILLLILVSLISAASFLVLQDISQSNKEKDEWASQLIEVIQEEPEEEKVLSWADQVQEKIALIKKRLALKWLIIQGDDYYNQWENTLALQQYLAFYKQNSEDPLIIEKLWDTYFSMHKYASAINYYKKLQDTPEKYILSLIYSTNLKDLTEIKQTQKQLLELGLSDEESFYYITSTQCAIDFHECKVQFGEYFWPNEETESEELQANSINFTPLADIKSAIQNYKNFQQEDISLKNAYLISAWYKNKLYSLSAHLSELWLRDKPDYKSLLKIAAQSYFKMWDYENARLFLGQYNTIDDTDSAIAYMIWVVNTNLREYLLANIHLSRSVKLWYSESIKARRLLVHNFYTLESTENMLKTLKELIEQEDFDENDFSIAVYYHILHKQYDWVEKNIQSGKEKFPENSNFYAYEWWTQREKWNLDQARETLSAWNSISAGNPFILINLAYTEKEAWDNTKALIYFKQTIAADSSSEFAIQARQEIQLLGE